MKAQVRTARELVDQICDWRFEFSNKTDLWYVSGPMSGYKDYNYPAFAKASAELRAMGRQVVSPHEHDLELEVDISVPMQLETRYQLLTWDLATILTCKGVYFLQGWEKSPGATIEHGVARSLGLLCEYEKRRSPKYIYGHYEAIPKQRFEDARFERDVRATDRQIKRTGTANIPD